MEKINEILEKDYEFRKINVTEDLYKLNDLQINSGWKYDLPTLVRNEEFSNIKINKNIKNFIKIFYEKYPLLYEINLDNLIIAGGVIRNILLEDNNETDIDIFMYGIKDIKEANNKIRDFTVDIYKNIQKIRKGWFSKDIKDEKDNKKTKKDNKKDITKEQIKKLHEECPHLYDEHIKENIQCFYNGNTINVIVNDIKIQFILRLYNTKSEILHGFDLGSSAIGFDGKDVYFTSLSKFCYENMVNIFDGKKRSVTYELRLVRYFEKGFSIILPEFDMSKLKNAYIKYGLQEVCEMPYLIFSYSNVIGNKIFIEKFYNINEKSGIVSDYDFTDRDDDREHKYKLFYHNLGSIVRKDGRLIYNKCVSDELKEHVDNYGNYDKWSLEFTSCVLQYEYAEKIYDTLLKDMKKNKIDLSKIRRYMNIENPEDIIIKAYFKENKKEYLEDLIQKQKNWIKDQLTEITSVEVKWITENPTSQLTSSINPIIEENEKWYGKYFKKI